MHRTRLITTAGLAGSLLLVTSSVALATPVRPTPTPPAVVASGLAAPFNLEVTRGRVFFADGFANRVGTIGKGGALVTLAADQPGASGVAVKGSRIAFTTTESVPETFVNLESGLHIWGPKGKRIYADTMAYEKARNPDQAIRYGVKNPSQCVREAFESVGFPVSYTGQVDSHAYSVTAVGKSWVVADAGSNTLWKIDASGKVRTLAVLPAHPATITAEAAAALGLASCVIGVKYHFESVPTDVERGRDGYLYVTTLPGGPESPVLGARGKVWRVHPVTGRAKVVADGFLGATNLAIGTRGEIYVAEFFRGTISVVKHRSKRDVVALPGVLAVETGPRGELWAATMGAGPEAPGTIVKVTHGRAKVHSLVKRR